MCKSPARAFFISFTLYLVIPTPIPISTKLVKLENANPKSVSTRMIRVFIVDDHEMYLEGLALLLKKQEGIDVIGTSSRGKELLELLPGLDIDVLLLDVHLPDIEEEDLLKQITGSKTRPENHLSYPDARHPVCA